MIGETSNSLKISSVEVVSGFYSKLPIIGDSDDRCICKPLYLYFEDLIRVSIGVVDIVSVPLYHPSLQFRAVLSVGYSRDISVYPGGLGSLCECGCVVSLMSS